MHISHFEVTNYKSFRETTRLEFKPGFNIITGQNSGGKTALLEALTCQFQYQPHRSTITVPTVGAPPPATSSVRTTFVLTRDELLSFVRDADYRWPVPVRGFETPVGAFDGSQGAVNAFLKWLLEQPEYRLTATMNNTFGRGESWAMEQPTLGLYPAEPLDPQNNYRGYINARVNQDGVPTVLGTARGDVSADVSFAVAQMARTRIYRSSAERFNMGQSSFGNNSVLSSNAQNLPEVLNVLQHNTPRLLHFNELLREILPQIQHVSVRPLPSQLEITVWPHDPDTEREDLALPLNQCGSGVGQVLAILYVVMTAQTPQTIVIDEPQSFLHPGAVRKLMEVLRRYPIHQYILATHSPTVITSTDPQQWRSSS
jgi:AAA domain, putative AbiEii toxin, Type IV TA system/AAA domain